MVGDSADLDVSTGDFTVELWVRPASFSGTAILVNKAAGTAGGYPFQIYTTATGAVAAWSYDLAGVQLYAMSSAAGALAVSVWTSLAFVRFGNTLSLYINGINAASAAYSGVLPANAFPMSIGAYSDGKYGFSGHIDEFRLTKGVARYTASFAPPTEPFPSSTGGIGGTLFLPSTQHTAASAAQIAASAPVPAFSTRRTAPLQLARDVEVGGPGTIYGTTQTKGTPNTPTKARVVLLCQRSKLPVRETWSDPVTGAFEFTGLDERTEFIALAQDSTGSFRPVAADRVLPEVPA
ncbi:LamG domain-containing protein [Ottowia pentelensis]|uniref:LamG domain-containing protein n=1 Tax=Ottowia pentelensis TaxID=511108 RepID=UPI00362EE92E